MQLKLSKKFIFLIVVCQGYFSNCNTANTNKSIVKLENLKKEKLIKLSDNEQINQANRLEKDGIQQPGSIENPNSYPIVGGWRLIKFHTDSIKILKDYTPHIVFNLFDMEISGTDGCNSMSVPILNFKNDRVEFGYMLKTKRGCGFGYDGTFSKSLTLTRKYKVKASNDLFFLSEDGDLLLEFERAN